MPEVSDSEALPVPSRTAADCLSGGGHMGSLMRAFDWSRTPVGALEHWPQSLRTVVSIILESKFPMYVAWGDAYTQFYNDGYRPILGETKHPQALGASARQTFPESWHIIGPMFAEVRAGTPAGAEDWHLPLSRHGYLEECYFTFSYSPVRDETGQVGGVLVTVTETTLRVLGERRLETLRDMASLASNARQEEATWKGAVEVFCRNPSDIAFALLYKFEDSKILSLQGVCITYGTAASTIAPAVLDSDAVWPVSRLAHSRAPLLLDDLVERFGEIRGAKWPEPVTAALLLPVQKPGLDYAYGLAVVGISPRRRLDPQYQSFLALLVDHIATGIGNVRSAEEERRRVESLAELDRAKTSFFSNISHELRTPLTLLLGPLEDMMASPNGHMDELQLMHRNALRLKNLVNTLLDFSRIEAGRMSLSPVPTDLAVLTADIASLYRSAIEKAGLKLIVECPVLPQPVPVDRGMWEKIVLNLLSNAFKYTLEGSITLRMRVRGDRVELSLEDTGCGISDAELPHLFERFYRVEGARGRTQEGTGIGLALVCELVHLHQGTIEVRSKLHQGSTFVVSIPFEPPPGLGESNGSKRSRSLPQTDGSEPRRDLLNLHEFTSAPAGTTSSLSPNGASNGRILVVDDNPDMRDYVARLLAGRYEVKTCTNGEEALACLLDGAPDLVLSDVMMPGLDGYGLLKAIRENPSTRDLPLIFLSARAGEEAQVEGLDTGATDYLVKPFTARELLARVAAHIQTSRARTQALATGSDLRAEAQAARDDAVRVLESITDGFFALDQNWRFTYINGAGEQLLGASRNQLLGCDLWEAFAPALGTIFESEYRRAMDDRVPVAFEGNYPPWQRWFAVNAYPVERGGISVYFQETTKQKQAEEALRESEHRFRTMADNIPNLAWMAHANGEIFWFNQRWFDYTGRTAEEMQGWGWKSVHRSDVLPRVVEHWTTALREGKAFEMEFPLLGADGTYQWFLTRVRPVRDDAGEITRWFGTNTNIDEQKRAVEALKQSEQLARGVIESSPNGVEVIAADGNILLINERGVALRNAVGWLNDSRVPWIESWSADNRDLASRALNTALSGSPAQFAACAGLDGDAAIWIDASLTPLIDAIGRIDRILCTTRDTTVARRAEAEMRQTAKLESLGVMAGGIAHDFNNLLTGILGNASLLAEVVAEQDRPIVSDVVLAAERAADLTSQMLAFAGKGRFQVSDFDLSNLAREISRLARPLIEKNVQVNLELEEDCTVEGDPGQLQQVIMNLMINAGDAMEGKAGVVTLRTAKVELAQTEFAQTLEAKGAHPGPYVLLEVSDSGKGMDEAVKARIFDPFFTTKFTGRGLGLAAVSGIVRGHHGILRVHSKPGEGTTFRLVFPSTKKSEAFISQTGAPKPVSRSIILLVDDEDFVQRVAAQVLERQGHQVILAANGKEAVDIVAARSKGIDLVLLDMMMPVMNGEQALLKIRECNASLPVVVCSGFNELEVNRRFASQAVGGFLKKPYTASQLLNKVNEILTVRKQPS